MNNDIRFHRFLLWLHAKERQPYGFYVIKVTSWTRTGQMAFITAHSSGFIYFTYEVVNQLNTSHSEKMHSGVIRLNYSVTVNWIKYEELLRSARTVDLMEIPMAFWNIILLCRNEFTVYVYLKYCMII